MDKYCIKTIDDLSDLHWITVKRILSEKNLMNLMLSNNKEILELTKLLKQYDSTAAACYAAAYLYVKKHGTSPAICEAIDLLKKAATKHKNQELLKQIRLAEEYTAWGTQSKAIPYMKMKKFPIVVPKTIWMNHSGFMNFLLFESIKCMNAKTGTDALILTGVNDLLNYLIKGKTKK